MKHKKLILIATVVISALGFLCGGTALIIKRNENALTPMNWCVEHIKEKNKFDENNITGFAYTGEEVRNEYLNDWDKTYFVEIVYDDWYEKWICGIAYKKTIWRLLTEDQIIKIECERLIKEELL
jgi:hypothetical protein